MNSFDPASIDPMGQHRPFDKQKVTLSQYYVISFTSTFKAVAALNSLAPSKCTGRLFYFANSYTDKTNYSIILFCCIFFI